MKAILKRLDYLTQSTRGLLLMTAGRDALAITNSCPPTLTGIGALVIWILALA